MADINKNAMSLKTVPFQFAEFKPIEYKPVEIDSNILNRSMEKIEARRNQAYQELDAFKRITAPLRDKLNAAEYAAFDAKVESQENAINTEIQNGNYGKAWILASQFGGSLVKDKNIQNKIKVEEQRNKRLDEINKGNYSYYTKLRYKEQNPYFDNGSGEFKEKFNPTQSFYFDDVVNMIVKETPTRQSTTTTGSSWNANEFKDKDNNITKTPGDTVKQVKTTTGSKHTTNSVTELTSTDLTNVFYNYLENHSEVSAGLKQEYESNIWAYNYYTKKLAEATTDEERNDIQSQLANIKNNIADENGIIPTSTSDQAYKKYLDRKIKKSVSLRAYKHTGYSHETSQGENYSLNKGNGEGNGEGYLPPLGKGPLKEGYGNGQGDDKGRYPDRARSIFE